MIYYRLRGFNHSLEADIGGHTPDFAAVIDLSPKNDFHLEYILFSYRFLLFMALFHLLPTSIFSTRDVQFSRLFLRKRCKHIEIY
jgi:hypothetical protein